MLAIDAAAGQSISGCTTKPPAYPPMKTRARKYSTPTQQIAISGIVRAARPCGNARPSSHATSAAKRPVHRAWIWMKGTVPRAVTGQVQWCCTSSRGRQPRSMPSSTQRRRIERSLEHAWLARSSRDASSDASMIGSIASSAKPHREISGIARTYSSECTRPPATLIANALREPRQRQSMSHVAIPPRDFAITEPPRYQRLQVPPSAVRSTR